MKNLKSLTALLLCLVLAVSFCACGTANETPDTPDGETVSFTLIVTDGEGNETTTQITTDKKTVGEALVAEGIVEGENGPYGLYIKSVNGITADYDTDGTYWAFYIDGEYASVGVDSAKIVPGTQYALKVQK